MMTECGVCGKRIVIPDPMFYVYKRGETFFCSKNCMIVHNSKLTGKTGMFRTERKEEDMNHRLTRDQKQKAVEMALQGGDYMAYLKKAGAKNPSAAWWYIKATLEKADPEKYKELMKVMEENRPVVEIAEKLPPEAVAEVPEELKEFDEAARQMSVPVAMSREEHEAITKPAMVTCRLEVNGKGLKTEPPKEAFQFTVTAILTGLGEFRKDSRDGLVYWVTEEGETIYLSHKEWLKLAGDIPRILQVLEGEE